MSRTVFIRVIAVHILCVLFLHGNSQTGYNKDSLITSKITTLEGFWKKYNDLSSKQSEFENTSVISDLFKVNKEDTLSRSEYLNKVNEAHIRQLKSDFGLSAVGNYQENFKPGIGAEDELVYNRRFQAGLDWDLLGNGVLNNRYKQQVIKNQNIINELMPQVHISANDYLIISHKIIYSFNIHKIELLEKRQQIINDKLEVANELYLLKHLPKLDMMQIIQQQVDVSSMFQIYKSYNEQLNKQLNFENLPKKIFPLFDLNADKLTSYSNLSASDSILKLQIKNLELENNSWKDINLKTQLRYNYYDIANNNLANRDFFSAGLSVSIPLPLGLKSNKNVIESQAELLKYDQRNRSTQQNLELLNSIYDFRYKLKQYNNFYEKHKKYEELIRIERVKEKLNDLEFNPVSSLNLIDEMLSVEIEMLDLQQEMYLQLLDIITKTPGTEPLSILMPYEIKEMTIPALIKQKAVYIWSDAQLKYDATYIDEYLRLNKISTAIISVRKDGKNKMQAIELIDKLKASKINSELLIGNNDLLTDKAPLQTIAVIVSGIDASKISAIHLDVEPHTLSDWASNKEKYLDLYVELIKNVKVYCIEKGWKLNVSIPVFYPEEALKNIYAFADNVYLMAYEHNNAEFIIKKVKEEFALGADKTIIALRAADFKNRNDFEKLVNEISTTLNTSRFALHDLESFIKLDEISVGGNEK